ncbi:DnaT-like ssDNA-binding domain-containing protein [Candidatus Tachikawaea gelatinosa]|uniref:Primosomal protein 1 n=1 Tax=Candidatus Tachikawaea gelatinosa TaxID=1410383 RepID=A0A090AL06_9ENTR|nr:DnaT-like ssDNA-binding domain-containing protein [Candidatus Tachikawaea gelatinosa]BAP58289.1 primosomal protein 1 [Candidatus Tachikawaea gelatinosa]
MSLKILTSTIIGIKKFIKNPIIELHQSDKGTLAVLDKNIPVMYVLTQERLSYLLEIEKKMFLEKNYFLDKSQSKKSFRKNLNDYQILPKEKFAMYKKWQPDIDFQKKAAVWGVILEQPVSTSELASFIDYWIVEECILHHVQWQQKLARNIKLNRLIDNKITKKKHTGSNNHHYNDNVPDGFRSE